MPRPSIALALIVKNEAHNLPVLFESFKDCFDEVHVTDTGSTDNTIEIAKGLGAQIHHFDWVNDFSAARNASFEPVKTDFVMWLDGDDSLNNPEAFKRFRNDAMGLADYWMATYHYASDAAGKPVCSFARERVMRTNKGLKWRYFIHEGIIPESKFGEVKVNFINTWSVNHRRSAADMNADRNRNLSMFEGRSLDSRLTYYYGKELFESGKHLQAYSKLTDAIKKPDLELHDRILSFQYGCYAAMSCNQYDDAIALAMEGLKIAPNRAELFCVIGDCYLKSGRINDAVPMYNAARACSAAGPSAPSPIFAHEMSYYSYPTKQLSRIYVHNGNLDKADQEISDIQAKCPDDESTAMHKDIKHLVKIIRVNPDATPNDEVVISCPPGPQAYPWDGKIYRENGLGGSETAAIEMAEHIAKKTGRKVKIFNGRDSSEIINGVEYIPNVKVNEYFHEHKPHTHIAWRHNMPITKATTYIWSHDLMAPGAENTTNYEKLLCLSPFHSRYVQAMQGVPEDKIWVTRNGISPARFKKPAIVKNPFKLVYPSSPDRGLDRAMEITDIIRKTHPIELNVYYGFDNLYKFGLGPMADRLKAMAASRPWVKLHGFTQQDKMVEEFRDASIWLHPANFIETFCITALEMLCSGIYPVTRRLGALQDTLGDAERSGMAKMLEHGGDTLLEQQEYAKAVCAAIDQKSWEKVQVDPEQFSWSGVADEWINYMGL